MSTTETLVLFGTGRGGPSVGFSVARFDLATGALTPPTLVVEAPLPAYFAISLDQRFLHSEVRVLGAYPAAPFWLTHRPAD